jgi:hypothetical protein
MKKKKSRDSAKSGDEALVTSDANTSVQSASPDPVQPGTSLQVIAEGKSLPDQGEPAEPNNQPMTPAEDQDLKRCEIIIEENKLGFLETCAALNEIWSKRLYRANYKSFKEYCKKWGFSRAQGYRLVKAHETMQKVSPVGDTSILTTNERQLRALAKVPEDQRTAVVTKAKKNAGSGKMTSRHIEEAARQATPEPALAEEENIHPPVTEPDKRTPANIITPAEFFPNAEILSLKELSSMADTLHDIFLNPSRNKEAGILLFKVKAHLHMYAEWERKHLANASIKEAA